tara:strand:- start:3077 stop:3451 length:375 start_codon:yes stop_codon:yes gene_type:complete
MRTVLIIDDEEDLTFFVKANLELSGEYKVIIANNGRDGIKAAEHLKPDVVLLDIMMPQMDGLEVLAKLKKSIKTLSIPVVMLSAKGDDESKVYAASSYNEDYIVKPVQIEFLKEKLDQVLGLRE